MARQDFNQAVRSLSNSEALLPSQGVVLAAVSGGADSMALLVVLHELAPEIGYRLAVAHFDHGLREASHRDRELVEQVAGSLGLSVDAGRGDVASLAAASGDPIEEAARKARYRFLFEAADRAGAVRLATGHTQSDQAETVMMRILRGAGVRGLAGIPVRRGRLVRPLLGVTRPQCRAYCASRGVPYIDDPTNEDTRFTRNRVRLELLPLLRAQYDPRVEENLIVLSRNAQALLDDLRRRTTPILEHDLRSLGPGRWLLATPSLGDLDETARYVLFGDLFSEWMGQDADLGHAHYTSLSALLDEKRPGSRLSLPGLEVRKEHDGLLFVARGAPGGEGAAPTVEVGTRLTGAARLELPGRTEVAGLCVRTEIVERPELGDIHSTEKMACFSLDTIHPPLVLRNPVPGDHMRPFGMSGHKKISDIFTDRKVPGRRRPGSLLVEDRDDILWLVGVATSEKSRIDEKTSRIVRITINARP